jgi:hypothetical protein
MTMLSCKHTNLVKYYAKSGLCRRFIAKIENQSRERWRVCGKHGNNKSALICSACKNGTNNAFLVIKAFAENVGVCSNSARPQARTGGVDGWDV